MCSSLLLFTVLRQQNNFPQGSVEYSIYPISPNINQQPEYPLVQKTASYNHTHCSQSARGDEEMLVPISTCPLRGVAVTSPSSYWWMLDKHRCSTTHTLTDSLLFLTHKHNCVPANTKSRHITSCKTAKLRSLPENCFMTGLFTAEPGLVRVITA